MTTRKYLAALSLAVSLGIHAVKLHGRFGDASPLLLPLSVIWVGFLLPSYGFVGQFERHILGYDHPWGAEHGGTSMLCVFLVAALIWFFPIARLERWFGTFDPVGDAGKGRLLSPVRGAAHALDFLNKRLFGRQKTGGWA